MERKSTPLGKTYWNNEGAYSKESDELSKELVEKSATHIPTNVHGRMLSALNMLYYDYCNNGNGNVMESIDEDCPECGGSGWEDGHDEEEEMRDCHCCGGNCTVTKGYEMEAYYKKEFDFLLENLPKADKHLAMKVYDFVCSGRDSNQDDYFKDENMAIYDQLADAVIYFILTTENKELD